MGNFYAWPGASQPASTPGLCAGSGGARRAGEILLLTSMDRDGTKSGFESRAPPAPVTRAARLYPSSASGGVGSRLIISSKAFATAARQRCARGLDLPTSANSHRRGQDQYGTPTACRVRRDASPTRLPQGRHVESNPVSMARRHDKLHPRRSRRDSWPRRAMRAPPTSYNENRCSTRGRPRGKRTRRGGG